MSGLILSPKDLTALSRDILRKESAFRFRAGGGSMRPFIRDGAILTVEPVRPEELQIGDILLYQSGGSVVAHRLLFRRKGRKDAALIMSGDALSMRLEHVSLDCVMGRIVRMEQDGRVVGLQDWFLRFSALIWAVLGLCIRPVLSPWRTARTAVARLLMAAQRGGWYHGLARRLLAGRVRYRAASHNDAAMLARLLGYPPDPDSSESSDGVPAEAETDEGSCRTVVATVNGKPVGAIVIRRFTEIVTTGPDWWIFNVAVRVPYRGAGIGKGLIIKAGHTIRHEPGARLGGQVRRANKSIIAACLGLGAREVTPAAFFPQLGRTVGDEADPTTILYAPVDVGIAALEAAGLLDEYRGTGCCIPD